MHYNDMSFGSYTEYLKEAIKQDMIRNEEHVKQCLIEIDNILNKDNNHE